MFDIGWSEMAVIAVVALVVLGPKEIPNALKTAAQWMRTARKLAREFQGGVDQIVREAELDEARKTVQQATSMSIGREIEKVVDPTGETRRDLNQAAGKPASAGISSPSASSPASEAGSSTKPESLPSPAPEPAATGDRPA